MYRKRSFLKFGMLATVGALSATALASCSQTYYDYFAELIVSSDTSVLADQSFSESSYEGWQEFMSDHGITMPPADEVSQSTGIWRRPGDTTQDFITAYKGCFASGTDMLITPGYNHATAIEAVIADSDYKNNGFLILDSEVGENGPAPNVASFSFRAEESGFLAAIATCEFLSANYDVFKSNSDDGILKVGGFVGIALPSTTDYLAGFQMGVFAYNAGKQSSDHEVDWITLGSQISSYSSGSFGVGDGVQKSQALLNKGASAIIPIAGPQTTDAVAQVKSLKKNAVVVGVDSAQEFQTVNQEMPNASSITIKDANGNKISNPEIIQMSAIKDLKTAVYKTLNAIFNKDDPNNANESGDSVVKGFGYWNIGTLLNGTTGVSDAGLPWVQKFNPSWVTTNADGTLSINAAQVESNQFYEWMEEYGYLYDFSTWPSNFDPKNANLSSDIVQGLNGNRAISAPNATGDAVDVAGGQPKLNGSGWELERD